MSTGNALGMWSKIQCQRRVRTVALRGAKDNIGHAQCFRCPPIHLLCRIGNNHTTVSSHGSRSSVEFTPSPNAPKPAYTHDIQA
jgi:hypothetical protein